MPKCLQSHLLFKQLTWGHQENDMICKVTNQPLSLRTVLQWEFSVAFTRRGKSCPGCFSTSWKTAGRVWCWLGADLICCGYEPSQRPLLVWAFTSYSSSPCIQTSNRTMVIIFHHSTLISVFQFAFSSYSLSSSYTFIVCYWQLSNTKNITKVVHCYH